MARSSYEAVRITKASRLERAGRLLHRDRWRSPLARATDVVPWLLSQFVTDDRPVTGNLERRLAAALRTEATRLRALADTLDRFARKATTTRRLIDPRRRPLHSDGPRFAREVALRVWHMSLMGSHVRFATQEAAGHIPRLNGHMRPAAVR